MNNYRIKKEYNGYEVQLLVVQMVRKKWWKRRVPVMKWVTVNHRGYEPLESYITPLPEGVSTSHRFISTKREAKNFLRQIAKKRKIKVLTEVEL